MSTISHLEPRAFASMTGAGRRPRLIDVRTPVEYAEVHAADAESIPLDTLTPEKLRDAARPDEPLCVICKSGARAKQAAEKLAAAGVGPVAVITGGTDAWVRDGLPVVRQRGVISLERQVRIAVGVILLTFATLSLTVHPLFVIGCAFMGAGLTFAGITNWCGLGLLLAAMPWNQTLSNKACCAK